MGSSWQISPKKLGLQIVEQFSDIFCKMQNCEDFISQTQYHETILKKSLCKGQGWISIMDASAGNALRTGITLPENTVREHSLFC